MATKPTFPIRKLLAVTPEMAKAISDYRFQNFIATESEATRRLIKLGLQADAKQQPAKRPGKQGR